MIELKYQNLNNADFWKAMRKLVDSGEIKKTELLMKIARIFKAVSEADAERVDLHQKLVKSYGVQDPESKAQKLYIPHASQEAFDAQLKTLMDTKFSINQEPLKYSEITA